MTGDRTAYSAFMSFMGHFMLRIKIITINDLQTPIIYKPYRYLY